MNRGTLRSIVAICSGWIAAMSSYFVIIVTIAIIYRDPFRPGARFATGWLLATLVLNLVCFAGGGFVTAVIARRREIEHAIGLVVLTLIFSLYLWSTNRTAIQVPTWYAVAGYALTLAPLLGAWLRMRQGILISRMPPGVVRVMGYLRFAVAIAASVCTFVIGSYLGVILGGAGLWALQRVSGRKHVGASLIPLWLVASVLLSSLLARCVYTRLMRRRA